MLLLSRRVGERLTINENIEIILMKIDKNHVRLGIEAPKDIRIIRNEIYDNYPKPPPCICKCNCRIL